MPANLVIEDPVPSDGLLPLSAGDGSSERPFSLYLHIPFCRVRCGYCDFNTYTSSELRGVRREDFADTAIAEIRFATKVLDKSRVASRPASTVFFGGGTPTLLPASDLVRMLDAVRSEFGLVAGAEITTEANPDSVDGESLACLAEGGFTRISFGMQSAVPHVLATLERTHNPERISQVVEAAKAAGLEVSLDLIYGTPGESIVDWQHSIDVALECDTNHLSAYSLIVEEGTALARRVSRGEIAKPDDDIHAEMYELADERFVSAGFECYEVSNWSRGVSSRSRHNLAYWTGSDWWGIGPGAHSHVGGTRWWNVKHPAAYDERISLGLSPGAGREVLTKASRDVERIMLGIRISEGLKIAGLGVPSHVIAGFIAEGLVKSEAALRGQLVLTRRGRLLADAVARTLCDYV